MTKKERLNRIRESIIGAAIEVHRDLVNVKVLILKDGIRRVVNDFPDSLRSLRAPRCYIYRRIKAPLTNAINPITIAINVSFLR